MKTSTITRLFLALDMLLFCMIGCDPLENGPKRTDTEQNITTDTGSGSQERHLYVSGISYPEGYDWRRDSAFGKVACNIFLMRDGEMVCSVPAGEAECAVADPDRHHIMGGHLYTEYSVNGQTVIQRDGKEILRYKGSETLKGMFIQDGKLLTLGQNRYAQGFSLRSQGKPLFTSEDGEIIGNYSDQAYAGSGALYEDEGRACFSYFTEEKGKRSWHYVEDGKDSALEYEGLSMVYDMRSFMGDRFAIVGLSGGKAPVLLSRGLPSDLSGSLQSGPANDYRLGIFEDRIFVVGKYGTGNKGGVYTGFWDEDGLITKTESDCKSFRYSLGHLDYLSVSSGKVKSATCGGVTTPVTGDWCIMTPQCLCWTENGPVLALSSTAGNTASPALWEGGTVTEIGINGFLTGISLGN